MKYKSKFDSVEALTYDGHNFKEVNDFCGGKLSWKTDKMEWSETCPPDNLIIQFNDEEIYDILVPGSFMIKFDNGRFGIIDGYDFLRLFKEVKDGE